MNWLLKITSGPMQGAEVALTNGLRVTVGSSATCDIVLADAALAAEAFSLDVTESEVMLIAPGGISEAMRSFEVHTFGTSSFAVGPAEGAWESLREKPVAPVAEEPEVKRAEEVPNTVAKPADAPEAEVPQKKRVGLWCIVLALVVLLILGGAAWVAYTQGFFGVGGMCRENAAKAPTISLAKLAAEHHLAFTPGTKDAAPSIKGNLKRRTERLAIRALALAADRNCRLDLTDEETLASATDALLFTITEGAITVKGVAQRAATLTGYAPSNESLAQVLAALKQDVPFLEKVDTQGVRVGGAEPPELAQNLFARTGVVRASEANGRVTGVTNAVSRRTTGPAPTGAVALMAAARANGGRLPQSLLPVAGILMKPYPCVVLQGGHRLLTGAKVLDLEITQIDSAAVTFAFAGENARWEP